MALAVLAAACSSGEGDDIVAPTPDSSTTETTATTTTTAEAPTTTEAPADDIEVLEENWSQVWNAAGAAEDDKAAQVADVAHLVTPELEQALPNLLPGEVQRVVEVHPVFAENDDGTVSISDCLYILPAQVSSIANWYEGVAELDSTGRWVITSIESRSLTGCVPAAVAEEVIADYEEFWAARFEYWNPADPDHPGVNGTMAGAHLERIRGLLEQHQRDGWYVVQTGLEIHAEVLRVDSPTLIVLLDCQLAGEERGLFDALGNRQPGLDPLVPDQRDIREVSLLLEDGQWKVTDMQAQENVECEFPPTPQGIPQV